MLRRGTNTSMQHVCTCVRRCQGAARHRSPELARHGAVASGGVQRQRAPPGGAVGLPRRRRFVVRSRHAHARTHAALGPSGLEAVGPSGAWCGGAFGTAEVLGPYRMGPSGQTTYVRTHACIVRTYPHTTYVRTYVRKPRRQPVSYVRNRMPPFHRSVFASLFPYVRICFPYTS